MKTALSVVLLVCAALLVACASGRTYPVAGHGTVSIGMTQDEVRRAIGEPDCLDHVEGGLSSWVYRHDKPERPDGLVEADEILFDDQYRVKAVKAILSGVGQ